MKRFLLLVSIFFALVSNSFAMNDVKGPPVSLIINTTLVKAHKGDDDYWHLMSEDFSYDNKEWNFFFNVKLPQATTANEALAQGTELLKNAMFQEPNCDSNPFGTNCSYNPIQGDYGVAAFNPPLHL